MAANLLPYVQYTYIYVQYGHRCSPTLRAMSVSLHIYIHRNFIDFQFTKKVELDGVELDLVNFIRINLICIEYCILAF